MMVGRRPRSGLDKLVRLGVMAEVLLAEVRRVPLDEAALLRLREAQEAVRRGSATACRRAWRRSLAA